MIVKAIYKPNFGDKTTGETYETQVKRNYGDVFECDDELANERIEKGFVKKASKKEIEEFEARQKELEERKDNNSSDDSKTIERQEGNQEPQE